ncbi:MAG: GIY-YIG nuclease family protein [bacterium]|nr:GIY-YIG nuclease family protein [bacterium]
MTDWDNIKMDWRATFAGRVLLNAVHAKGDVELWVRSRKQWNKWWIEARFDGCFGEPLGCGPLREAFDAPEHSFETVLAIAESTWGIVQSAGVGVTGWLADDRYRSAPVSWDGSLRPSSGICNNTTCMCVYNRETLDDHLCPDCAQAETSARAVALSKKWQAEYNRREIELRRREIEVGAARANPSHLYLIQNGDTTHYKIGITGNVKNRVAAIQTSNPQQVGLVHTVKPQTKSARRVETQLHKHFADRRVYHEWFNLGAEQVEECIALMDAS